MACIQFLNGLTGKLGVSVWGQKVRARGNDHFRAPKQSLHSRTVQADIRKVRDPRYNKDLAFTYEERQHLNVIGLLPAAYQDMELQLYGVCERFHAQKENLDKYAYLRELRCRNERLFYSFLNAKVAETLPIMYTPTVGAACVNFSKSLYQYALGLYVTKYDKGHMVDVLKNWPYRDIRAVCVTDGERILGLGDQGANGMGISVGKLDLYSILAKISPEYLIPIMLDVGTNNKVLLEDPLYIGVREPRLRGAEFEEIVQEFVDAVVQCFGSQCIIHFEDFATPNAFKLINKYQDKYCCFNDDVQGTAAVGLGGFLGVERVTKVPLQEHVFFFVGAGSACLGMAKLLVQELLHRKVSKERVTKNIYISDVDGVITKKSKNLLPDMTPFLKDMAPSKSLEEIVNKIKPSIIIGATGQGGIFSENVIRSMAKNHKRPGIFACSNPTNKSECTAEQAIQYSEGRALFCSGSPFPPVVFNGKRVTHGQINNAFAFPGVVLATFCCQPYHIPDEFYLLTARAMSDYVAKEKPDTDSLYPNVKMASDVAFYIATKLSEYMFEKKIANVYPKPCSICEFLKKSQYHPTYTATSPTTWCYPEPKTKT